MTGKIVVGVSGSEHGHPALTWAVERAERSRTPLHLVHIVDDSWGSDADRYTADAVTLAEQQLHDHADRIRGEHPNLRVHTAVLIGSAAYVLSDYASDADLLVVGSRRTHGFGRTRFSLLSARVAAYARCSVLIIPTSSGREGAGFVVGVDGSALSLKAVDFAAAEADRRREPLTAVHAWQPPWFWGAESGRWPLQPTDADELVLSESLAGLAERYPDLKITRLLPSARTADALEDAAAGARMLVVGSHGRGAIGRAVLGSVSEELALSLPCALAVIR